VAHQTHIDPATHPHTHPRTRQAIRTIMVGIQEGPLAESVAFQLIVPILIWHPMVPMAIMGHLAVILRLAALFSISF
jgi:hypothetical protein